MPEEASARRDEPTPEVAETQAVPDLLAGILGYEPHNPELLSLACNHRSWCAEHPGYESNERLEFLGDAVLGFVIAEMVYRAEPDLDEGSLTDIRKAVVNSVCLAEVASDAGIGRHIRLGRGEEASGGREKQSILADAFEAMLGAVYLDGGMDAARGMVERLLADRVAAAVADGGRSLDHKSRLQERLATLTDATAEYEVVASGPDHARHFTATVLAAGRELGVGTGRSKKLAEQQAARAALGALENDGAVDAPNVRGKAANG